MACYPDIKLNDNEKIEVDNIGYLAKISLLLRSIESNSTKKRFSIKISFKVSVLVKFIS